MENSFENAKKYIESLNQIDENWSNDERTLASVLLSYAAKTENTEYTELVKYQAKSIEKEKYILPGRYTGIWGGSMLRINFKHGNKSHPIKMDQGIRCVGRNVSVMVDNQGNVYII